MSTAGVGRVLVLSDLLLHMHGHMLAVPVTRGDLRLYAPGSHHALHPQKPCSHRHPMMYVARTNMVLWPLVQRDECIDTSPALTYSLPIIPLRVPTYEAAATLYNYKTIQFVEA